MTSQAMVKVYRDCSACGGNGRIGDSKICTKCLGAGRTEELVSIDSVLRLHARNMNCSDAPIPIYRYNVELVGCSEDRSVTYNLEAMHGFLDDLVNKLDVQEIARTVLYIGDKVCPDKKPGISALVIFLESGLMVHTWPEERFATVDIFSCKEFRKDYVDEVIEYCFMPEEIRVVYG